MAKKRCSINELIKNVHDFHIRESNEGLHIAISRPCARSMAALNISRTSLHYALKNNVRGNIEAGKKKGPGRPVKLDSFDIGLIRRVMHEAFIKREVITLDSLRDKLYERGIVISRSTIHRYIRACGFTYKRRGKDR